MCALRVYINNSFYETFYEKLKKVSKKSATFSFFYKKFHKMVLLIYTLRAYINKTHFYKWTSYHSPIFLIFCKYRLYEKTIKSKEDFVKISFNIIN